MNLLKSIFPISIPFRPVSPIRVSVPQQTTFTIGHRTCRRMHVSAGQCVDCVNGTVWITRDGDIKDVVISAGEVWVSDCDGAANFSGLESAVVSLCD